MKYLLLSAIVLMFNVSQADDVEAKQFCEAKAVEYVQNFNGKILEDIGVIQGYEEYLDVVATQTKGSADEYYANFTEKYTVSISANNDEGDWWVSTFEVEILASVSATDSNSVYCDVRAFNYKGVTESGSPEYEE